MYKYTFTVRLGDKEVNCRAFTLKEYLGLIGARATGTIESTVNNIITNCSNAKNLTKQEAELLLVNLWAHSLGEVNQEHTWNCSCGHSFQVYMNLLHTQLDEQADPWYSFSGIKIKFRQPKLFDDKNIALMIASCIEAVFVNGESIPVEDLTEAEINDLYGLITEDDMINIKNLLVSPSIYLATPIKCPKCGTSHVHTIRGLKEFFELL